MTSKIIRPPSFYPFKLRILTVEEMAQNPSWGIKILNVSEAWILTKGKGVKIAVLDTAGDTNHSDLVPNVKKGANFTSYPDYDAAQHGTHCAGIIAALNNDIGVVGVAPEAEVYLVKVLGDNGSGSFEGIAKGIDWCIENKIDIISMSLGSNYNAPEMEAAVNKAYEKNITMVCAAGNDSRDVDFPGAYEKTIAVGSIDKDKNISYFSSPGQEVDIAAPGGKIRSTIPDDRYAEFSGTSMATPFVVGVLALMISKHRNSKQNKTPIDTPDQIREHLLRCADDAGRIGKDEYFGYGIVNPNEVLKGLTFDQIYHV